MRQLLKEGEVDELFSLTNRYYQVTGKVVHGDKRGRTIGFPTANIRPSDSYVLPKQGVYAVLVRWGEHCRPGVLNLGIKPTFQSSLPEATIEVHLFDFDGDLYDNELSVQWVSFLREEKKFESIEYLKQQITQDVLQAKQKLSLII
jgi:riboflavin kinase/FMN adenylyltransferase